MLEILYRIYLVPEKTEANDDNEFCGGLSISRAQNIELAVDCLICDTREQFKDIIKSTYGEGIKFCCSKKQKSGDIYCIIIGEHCYNTEKYFVKKTFTCDYCHSACESYAQSALKFTDWELSYNLYGIQSYKDKNFCSYNCKNKFIQDERRKIKPEDTDTQSEIWINRDSFTQSVGGYVYKITKKSTGEFYIGQTKYAPIFRWGQHLTTDRFPTKDITDYQFEVLEIVPLGTNILERESHYIQECQLQNPEKSLNISGLAKVKNQASTVEQNIFDELMKE